MTRTKATWLSSGIATIVTVFLVAIATVSPAAAAQPVTIEFVEPGPVTAQFTSPWTIPLVASVEYYEESGAHALTTASGTVDVYVSSIGGAYAVALPIQADGRVYFTQPTDRDYLAAGEYDITAVFNPAPGSAFPTAQTTTSLTLTIEGIPVAGSVEVTTDSSVSDVPVISGQLSGDYVTANHGGPTGSWAFVVTDANGKTVFEKVVAYDGASTDPVRTPLTAKLSKGATYTVTGTFVPDKSLLGGFDLGSPATATLEVPSDSLVSALTSMTPFPERYLVVMLPILLLILAAFVTTLAWSRRVRIARPAVVSDTDQVELMSIEEAGMRDLNEPATWSLSADADLDVVPDSDAESDDRQPSVEIEPPQK